jgi:hypothetical protein
VDASFATRHQMRSQTGATLSFGRGSLYSMARKQKLNGVHDAVPQIIWFRYFLLAQEVKVSNNILFQDNQSAIVLHRNGMVSSLRNTRHINVRYFFIEDQIKAGEVEILHCPSSDMIADFFTKPFQGKRFFPIERIDYGRGVQ